MKVINRFIYAVVLALGLYSVFNVTHTVTLLNALEVIGQEEIDQGNIQAFVTTRYSYDTPKLIDTIAFEDAKMTLYVYEVANINNESLEVFSGLQFIFHQTEGTPLELPMMVMINGSEAFIFDLVQVVGLPVYLMYPGVDVSFFTSDLFTENYTSLTLLKDGTSIHQVSLDILPDATNIQDVLDEYIAINQQVPLTSFGDVVVSDTIDIDTTPTIIRNVTIYVFVAGGVTWFFFFRKKPNKGNKAPTPMLNESLIKKR